MNERLSFHEAANIFPMMEGEEYKALLEDIREHGLREPITIFQGKILDGRNRSRACEDSGVQPRFREWEGHGSPVDYVVSLNLKRRHLNETQRAMVAARAEPMYAKEASDRKVAAGKIAGKQGGRGNIKRVHNKERVGAKLPQPFDASGHAASSVNVSERSVKTAKAVLATATPELIAACDAGKVAVSAAAKLVEFSEDKQREVVDAVCSGKAKSVTDAVRQLKREELAARGVESLPKGKYRVLYADPPWRYSDSRMDVEGYQATAAQDHYPTMSVDELCALEVAKLADDNAVLFCWATFPLLQDALHVVRSWGFSYKTAFVWAKVRSNFGHYHNANAELLLVCTRGSGVPDADKRESQVQQVERKGKHSEKPEEFRMLIDRLYTSGKRIELFRRGDRPDGWDVWGNEADNK